MELRKPDSVVGRNGHDDDGWRPLQNPAISGQPPHLEPVEIERTAHLLQPSASFRSKRCTRKFAERISGLGEAQERQSSVDPLRERCSPSTRARSDSTSMLPLSPNSVLSRCSKQL